MKHEDAVTIAGIISDITASRRGQNLFPEGKDGTPSTLGVIWIDHIAKIPDADTELATMAAIDLMVKTTRLPQPSDFTDMLQKLRRDRETLGKARSETHGLPEPDFKRELPEWMKGKLVALSHSDSRVWVEQKAGYDFLQRSTPQFRTYVWGEQEQISEEDRERFVAEGAHYTADDFRRIFQVVGSVWKRP